MAYVTPIYGGSPEQVDYRLGVTQHGCAAETQVAYRTQVERPLRWIGGGLDAFGDPAITAGAVLTGEQHDAARALLSGRHPVTGEQLVSPKLAVAPDAKVPLAPLVDAVTAAAVERGVEPGELFAAPKLRAAFARAERAVGREGAAAALRVDDALGLAEAAGVDSAAVWPGVDLAGVYANLFEPRLVRDAEGGVARVELAPRRVPVGIVGFDLGVTLPKSLSLLLAFAPEELADRVEQTYVDAVGATFDWVEGRTSYVLRGKHGDGRTARAEATAGLSGWVMTHRAARPVGEAVVGDPHWHVHITIAHMAQAPDGSWLTIASGGRDLMRHAPAADKLTQAGVRHALHREFGVEFARSERTGLWEVAHIPEEAIGHFSKRGKQTNAALAELGLTNTTTSAAQARWLTRHSRAGKTEVTLAADATLRELWHADAVLGLGADPAVWIERVFADYRAGLTTVTPAVDAAIEARFGIGIEDLVAHLTHSETGLTAHARRFSELDAVAAVADALPLGAGIGEVEMLTAAALAHPGFVALAADPLTTAAAAAAGRDRQLAGAHRMAGGAQYTTADVPAAEREILAAARAAHPGQGCAVVDPEVLAMAVDVVETAQGFALSDEQRDVLARVTSSGAAVAAIEGPPGTGKTTLMRAARLAWTAQGHTVAGAATAAVAAQNLQAESGIESFTVAQWLWRIDHKNGLAGVDVLVLDEANLTDDRARARLYRAAAEAGTKVVEVGDPRQLRGVGAGSMFGYLHALLDGPRLTENRRQRGEGERRALAAFRDGRHVEALRGWNAAGGLVATETGDQALAELVAGWLRLREGAPDPHTLGRGLLALAATNEQVERINHAIQAVRAARGELGPTHRFQLPRGREVEFAVGDLVLIRRNDRHGEQVDGAPVLNGYRGVVTDITDEGVHVAWHPPGASPDATPQTALCPAGFIADGGLDLGYALTTHKAEGLTVNGAWTHPDGTHNHGTVLVWAAGMDNPGLYVAASRDRGRTLLYAARADLETDRDHLHHGPPRNHQELTDRVITALADRAAATATNANDRPVLVDLGHAPTDPKPAPAAPSHHPDSPDAAASPAPTDDLDAGPMLDISPDAVAARMRAWRADVDERDRRHHEHHAHLDQQRVDVDQAAAPPHPNIHPGDAEPPDPEPERVQRAREAVERLRIRADWRQRPHALLTDPDLARQISAAAAAHRDALARHQGAVDEHARLAAAVDAGQGPAVTAHEHRLQQLGSAADLARDRLAAETAVADAERRYTQLTWAAARAEQRAQDAPWYAVAARAHARRETAELAEQATHAALAEHAAREHLHAHRHAHPTIELHGHHTLAELVAAAEDAHTTRDTDHHAAARADTQARDRAAHQVERWAGQTQRREDRHQHLLDEQQLRGNLAPQRREREDALRDEVNQRRAERQHDLDQRRATQLRSALQPRPTQQRHDPYHGTDFHHGYGRGHGPGLSR